MGTWGKEESDSLPLLRRSQTAALDLSPGGALASFRAMSQRRSKRRQPERAVAAPASPAGPIPATPAAGTRARRWALRLLAAILLPALLLGAVEAGLRLAGYGYDTRFFLRQGEGDAATYVENPQFGRRFFPPQMLRGASSLSMKAHKAPGSIRIFVFGESAALGDPQPRYGASRYLEALLRERFPDQPFEVINTSLTAINSHVILPIARECAHHAGDLWLVYMGNNEMVGPFGAATVFGSKAPPLSVVRLNLAIQRTRLGQLLLDLGRRLQRKSAANTGWQGMEMFLQNEVPPADPRRAIVHANFRANLEDLVRCGQRSGARVILSTMAVNLKDCPPFASQDAAHLPPTEQAAVQRLLAEARTAEDQGQFSAAAARYQEALRLLPTSAALQFGFGQALLRQGDTTAARTPFEQARDFDTLPFRADSRINETIAQLGRTAAEGQVVLCDAAASLAADSPAGSPGNEFFYEHVHFNFDGNYRLARLWADAVTRALPASVTQRAVTPWADQERCEQRLGLTDWNRVSVLEEMLRRLERPPLSTQTNNRERVAAFQARRDQLRQRLGQTPPAQARAVYEDALRRNPDDAAVRENFAEFLEATDDTAGALAERRKVCELRPHSYFPHYCLGTLLKEQRQLAEARKHLERAVRLHPLVAEARIELGAVLALEKQWEAARRELAVARKLSPGEPRAALFLGNVLAKLNQPAEALRQLRTATELGPNLVEARYRYAEELAVQGQLTEAVTEFTHVLRLAPGHVKAHLNLGVALAQLGRLPEALREFDETLRLDPQNPQALQFKRNAEGAVRR